jgi:hypothetical protein
MVKRSTVGGIEVDETEPLSLINMPIDWKATWKLAKQARAVRFLQDIKGNIIAFPTMVITPNSSQALLKAQPDLTSLAIYGTQLTSANGVVAVNLYVPAAPGATTKHLRVLGGFITMTSDVACAALQDNIAMLTDSSKFVIPFTFICPAVSVVTGSGNTVIPLTFGPYGMTTANGATLTFGLTNALTAGTVTLMLWAVEEVV